MSNETPAGRTRSPYRSQISRWLLVQYFAAIIVYVFAFFFCGIAGWSLCHMITWQPTDPVYWILAWVRDYLPLVIFTGILGGWIVITYLFFRRPLRYLDEVVHAAEQLAQPDSRPVVLPRALVQIERELNLVREKALQQAELARAEEQRKSDLIVYLAHDLKTPLTSVIGYLTLLRDEPQISPELRARYTGIALEKAQRLEELINEFFDITRFSLSHLELELQPVDLRRMLEQVTSEFLPQLEEKGLRCRLDLPPRLVYSCDPDKLARVFDNLLRNACYYSFPNSTVEITGRETESQLLLSFTNEGRTIPPEKLNRVFEQFFRLDSARSTHSGGAGLGLAIAKEIVELHGGTIEAWSQDNRICFTITLPRAAAAAAPAGTP